LMLNVFGEAEGKSSAGMIGWQKEAPRGYSEGLILVVPAYKDDACKLLITNDESAS
jgi:hypothetical protein